MVGVGMLKEFINENGKIIKNVCLVDNIWEMVIESKEIAKMAKAGQFVNVRVAYEGNDPLLRRPISLCDVNAEMGLITLVYAVIGRGTKLMSEMTVGRTVETIGPVGNGFPINGDSIDLRGKSVAVVGGGIGTAPLLQLTKELKSLGVDPAAYLGFRGNSYKVEEFQFFCDTVTVATENGCEGFTGFVTEPFADKVKDFDVVYSCGPEIMMRRVAEICRKAGVKLYVSMEERMGCGIGACLVCVCKTKADNENGWHHSKVCTDGPIFLAEEVFF